MCKPTDRCLRSSERAGGGGGWLEEGRERERERERERVRKGCVRERKGESV